MIEAESTLQSDWEDLGTLDPLWAVLSEPKMRHGKWNEADFYKTGQEFIGEVLAAGSSLACPAQKERALDFGCGVGRLTYALCEHFKSVVGVDVSLSMLEKAQNRLDRTKDQKDKCQFVHNTNPDLKLFPSDSFDFVGSYIVLQHIPERKMIESYISEFVRVLKPGGLLFFQIPTFVPRRNRVQLKRRAYSALRKLGVPKETLYSRLGLHPIYYNYIPTNRVDELLSGCQILKRDSFQQTSKSVVTSNYYVTK